MQFGDAYYSIVCVYLERALAVLLSSSQIDRKTTNKQDALLKINIKNQDWVDVKVFNLSGSVSDKGLQSMIITGLLLCYTIVVYRAYTWSVCNICKFLLMCYI